MQLYLVVHFIIISLDCNFPLHGIAAVLGVTQMHVPGRLIGMHCRQAAPWLTRTYILFQALYAMPIAAGF